MQLEADFRKGKQTPKDRIHLDGEVNTGLVAGRCVLPDYHFRARLDTQY
jgi:hypothetical protein